MSAIAAILSREGDRSDPAALALMLRTMRLRGGDRVESWTGAGLSLGVSRHAWELGSGFHGPGLVVRDRELVIAADASLYYRHELRARLRGRDVRPSGATAGHLILAAYRAWGLEALTHLEGDYAFVLWDGGARTLLCARDFAGTRPLHYAEVGHMVLVGSTVAAVLAHPLCPGELNVALIGETAAGLCGVGGETCHSAVSVLPAGHRVAFGGGRTELRRFWNPPSITPFRSASFDEGALALRTLLERAVAERLDPVAPTSVWLSGGRDSSAVFGVGMSAIHEGRATGELLPVSLSFPPGDPARDDEAIDAVLTRWGVPAHWIDVRDVRLLDGLEARARAGEDAFLYAFDPFLRALAAGSRALGARVALTGNGGDYLFAARDVYLSDLFYRAHWLRLAREWRRRSRPGKHPFFWWVVRPGLPPWACAGARVVRGGRELVHPTEPPVPPWIRPGIVAAYRARTRDGQRSTGWGGSTAADMRDALAGAPLGRLHQGIASMALETGVEMRHPLLDERVVALAASRPWSERSADPDTKRLLRRAMADVLPPAIGARRAQRTGDPSGHFERLAREVVPGLIRAHFSDSHLAALGIVDATVLQRIADEYAAGGVRQWSYHLAQTLNAELWLRGRTETAQPAASPREESRREVVAC